MKSRRVVKVATGESQRDNDKSNLMTKRGRVSIKSDLSFPEESEEKKTDSKSFTRKYFWGTVAVASFGVGISCIMMALTMSNGERRPRRWQSSRAY